MGRKTGIKPQKSLCVTIDTKDIDIGPGAMVIILGISDFFQVSGDTWCMIEGYIELEEKVPVSIPCRASTIIRAMGNLTPEARLAKIKEESRDEVSGDRDNGNMVSRSEAAEILGISVASITNLVKRGLLTPTHSPAFKGACFRREEVEEVRSKGAIKGRRRR